MPRRRTCLGTHVLALGKTNDSGDDEVNAALLVECEERDGEDDHDSVLAIKLSTGTSSYGCTILPSELSSLAFRGGDSKTNETGDGDGDDYEDEASRIIALGRLFLRGGSDGDDDDDKNSPGNIHHETSPAQNGFQNLTIHFQYETATNISGISNDNSNNGDEGCRGETINDSGDQRRDLVLVIHENLANGMKRTLLRRKLDILLDGKHKHKLSYCRAVGNALNRALVETDQLKSGRELWKKTAEDLGRMQQVQKDALLANFTKLRNHMVQHHHAQLEELKRVHETEKESWAVSTATTNATTLAKKAPKKRIIKQEVDLADQLFAQEDALALAQGRKLGASNNKDKSNNENHSGTNNDSSRRKAVLKAADAADMVKILREGEAFQRNRNEIRKRKRQQTESNHQQEESYQLKSSETSDAFDREKHKPMAVGRDRRKDGKPTPSRVKSGNNNSNNSSLFEDDDIGVVATAHESRPPPRGRTTFREKQKDRETQQQESPRADDALAPAARKRTILFPTKESPAANDGSSSSESSWTLR